MMLDDVPHLPNTVSWAEARASIEERRAMRVRMKLDPDEGAMADRAWDAIRAEKRARFKGRKP